MIQTHSRCIRKKIVALDLMQRQRMQRKIGVALDLMQRNTGRNVTKCGVAIKLYCSSVSCFLLRCYCVSVSCCWTIFKANQLISGDVYLKSVSCLCGIKQATWGQCMRNRSQTNIV